MDLSCPHQSLPGRDALAATTDPVNAKFLPLSAASRATAAPFASARGAPAPAVGGAVRCLRFELSTS